MSQEKKFRVQLDLYSYEVEALDDIRNKCGLRSRADTIRTALSVMEWVTNEVQKGKHIFSAI